MGLAVVLLVDDDPADDRRCAQGAQGGPDSPHVFGIPLSVATLVTGIVLGVGTKWGVLRYPWVAAKLLLIISVMAVGALVLGPSVQGMLDGTTDAKAAIVAAATCDVVALCLATGLSVFKPGRRMSRRRTLTRPTS